MELIYRCKENNSLVKFCYNEKGEIEEIHVQADGEDSCTVIGYQDFLAGLIKTIAKIQKEHEQIVS